jgi:predicted dithiol-disulfide oxidoreductase (DUF899 family)
MSGDRIVELEQQIGELMAELHALQKASPGTPVRNYTFDTPAGRTTLHDLFGGRDRLLAIHNMGQGCRYCTLWADGFNGLVPHLESVLSVVLLSKDTPETQRRFANARGWRFQLASHGGGDYIREQSVMDGDDNFPGAVVYQRDGDAILRKNACAFGPGDIYCAMWTLLGLAGLGEEEWTPQFNYWRRPNSLDDGGQNVLD